MTLGGRMLIVSVVLPDALHALCIERGVDAQDREVIADGPGGQETRNSSSGSSKLSIMTT